MAKYVDGFLLVVPKDKLAEYKEMAGGGRDSWMKHGALAYYECRGSDLCFTALETQQNHAQAQKSHHSSHPGSRASTTFDLQSKNQKSQYSPQRPAINMRMSFAFDNVSVVRNIRHKRQKNRNRAGGFFHKT